MYGHKGGYPSQLGHDLNQNSQKQSVGHLHRLADDWQALQLRVMAFMQQFQGDSEKLLRYVGLLPEGSKINFSYLWNREFE